MPRIPGIRKLFRLDTRRADVGADVDEEIAFHVEERIDELVAHGLSREEARREAIRLFGDVDRWRDGLARIGRERVGRERRAEWWSGVWQDVRYAMRGMRAAPGFAITVVLTLGLGIGANATMFGIIDRILLRPPSGVVDAESVRRVFFARPDGFNSSRSYPDYVELRDSVKAFADVAAWNTTTASLGEGESAQEITISPATPSYFRVLGVRPALGRFYTDAEDTPPAGARVAVLGWRTWARRFGADSSMIGRTIVLSGDRFTIIGVAPKGFNGLSAERVDLYVPVASIAEKATNPDWYRKRNWYWLDIAARMRAGVSDARGAAEATAVSQRGNADRRRQGGPEERVVLTSVIAAKAPNAPPEAKVSLWLVGVSAIVLLIACANVANLLLARASHRGREIAVRLALGVGRGRLAAQLLIESVMLAALGALAALVIARWGGAFVRGVLMPTYPWDDTGLDARVLLFAAGATLVTGLLTGLAPVLQGTSPDLTEALKSGAREGGYRKSRLRTALVVMQAALSVALLVGAGLFARSLRTVTSQDMGYDTRHLLIADIDVKSIGYDSARANAFYDRARERLAHVGGVASVSLGVGTPFRWSFGTQVSVPGLDSVPRLEGGGPYGNAVSNNFFTTSGTRIVRGRPFGPGDVKGASRVAVITETMARTLWRGGDALGRCIKIGGDSVPCTTVVGVAQDFHRDSVEPEESMQFFVPLEQGTWDPGRRTLLIRTAGEPSATRDIVRRELQSLAPNLPYADVEPLEEIISPQVRPWRLGATMFGIFAGLALLVAAVGLYSVVAYEVAQRTREMGIRIALGAASRDVVALVVRDGIAPALAGVVLGLALALAASRAIASLLFDTSPRDPLVLGACATVLLVVALVASVIPARRATRVDPMEALRAE
jgi:predicted permease